MNLTFAAIATTLLVVRALSRKSLTVSGVLAAVLTAGIHALHPWNLPFVLLLVFYGLGTAATKVKHDIKAKLTISSSGTTGGEGPRTHSQVSPPPKSQHHHLTTLGIRKQHRCFDSHSPTCETTRRLCTRRIQSLSICMLP
jgi:hypothetical protein